MYRYFLALRYLLSRPINLLGMAGVMVSVWALILVVSIFSGFLVEVRAHVKSANSDLTVLALPWPSSYAELRTVIERDPNVAACAPRLIWYGLLHSLGKSHERRPGIQALQEPGADSPFVMMLGIDPAAEARVTGFRDWLTGVDAAELRVDDPAAPLPPVALQDGGQLPGILISERRLQSEFVRKGARVVISSARLHPGADPRQQQLSFIDHDFVIAGAYRTRHHAFDNANCLVEIGALAALMEESGVADPVTEIVVRCVDPEQNHETAERLERAVNATLPRGRQQARAYTWQRLNEAILTAVDHQRALMKLVLFVIMVVAAFLMYATLSMMVTEKTHDIGILSAMGATRRGVLQVFLSCGLAIAVIGSLLGVVVGCLSSLYLDPFNTWLRETFNVDLFPTRIYNLERVPYDLDPLWITQVAGMALGLGLLVSGLPAWRAARHDPLVSLRNE